MIFKQNVYKINKNCSYLIKPLLYFSFNYPIYISIEQQHKCLQMSQDYVSDIHITYTTNLIVDLNMSYFKASFLK